MHVSVTNNEDRPASRTRPSALTSSTCGCFRLTEAAQHGTKQETQEQQTQGQQGGRKRGRGDVEHDSGVSGGGSGSAHDSEGGGGSGGDGADGHSDGDDRAAAPPRKKKRRAKGCKSRPSPRHKTSAPPQDMQPDTLGRCVSDTHGTFVPASLSLSYRGVGCEQSPNRAERMMSCVRCSMKVLNVRLFCPWSVSGTG